MDLRVERNFRRDPSFPDRESTGHNARTVEYPISRTDKRARNSATAKAKPNGGPLTRTIGLPYGRPFAETRLQPSDPEKRVHLSKGCITTRNGDMSNARSSRMELTIMNLANDPWSKTSILAVLMLSSESLPTFAAVFRYLISECGSNIE